MTKLSSNAIQVAEKRYLHPNEDWQGASARVGYGIGQVESRPGFSERFSEIVYNLEFMPGGRILRNVGRLRGSLFNCYVLPFLDSIEDIGQFIKEAIIVWAEGGGVGTNVTPLRPEKSPVMGKGGNASGPISFLVAADAAARCIESGGQRRAAGMAMMLVTHPDIVKFIDAKTKHEILNHFNISVGVVDSFLDAVESDSQWQLSFNHTPYGEMPARELWNNVMHAMVTHAEPGLINWDFIAASNSYYFAPIVATNPCGEAPLEAYGICDLGSIVLTSFLLPSGRTNWKRMEEVIRLAVRMLDDVIDVNRYIFPEFDKAAHDARRVGLGVMGLADYLFAKKLRYGSPRAIQETEKVMRFLRDVSYDESMKLAVEKGAFTKFDASMYCKAQFIRSMPPGTRMDIKRFGMRNCTLLAIAPTGTISLIPEVSPSIEPLMAKAYFANDRVSKRLYVHPIFDSLVRDGKLDETPEWYVDAYDLDPKAHLDTQVAVQKFTDGAVSKTINMPKGTTEEELSGLLLEYIHDLKGVTVYVDESRPDQPIKKMDVDLAVRTILSGDIEATVGTAATECHSGKCDI